MFFRDRGALAYAINRSCENEASVVSLDEKESGLRATLNLGYTFGHVSAWVQADSVNELIFIVEL